HGGELNDFGRAEAYAREGQRHVVRATSDARRESEAMQRFATRVLPGFNAPEVRSPLLAYNKLGPDANTAAGFRDTVYGAIGQGRSIKEGMLLVLRQAFLKSGAGSDERPTAMPCRDDGTPRLPLTAVPAP